MIGEENHSERRLPEAFLAFFIPILYDWLVY